MYKMVQVRQKGFLPWLIRLITNSKWNHTAILKVADDTIFDFDRPGLRIFQIKDYLTHNEIKHTEYKSTFDDMVEYNITKYSQDKYSDLKNIAIVIKLLRKYVKGENCVSWCAKVLGYPQAEWKVPGWFK